MDRRPGVAAHMQEGKDAVNREQKIALIVGFGVVLVVGVFVSDHLSRSRQAELADAATDDPGLVELAAATPELPAPPAGGIVAEPDRTQAPAFVQADPPTRALEQGPAPLLIAQGEGTDSPLGSSIAGGEASSSGTLVERLRDIARAQGVTSDALPVSAVVENIPADSGNNPETVYGPDGRPVLVPISDTRAPSELAQPGVAEPTTDSPNHPPAQPQSKPSTPARTHVVAKSESLYTIAKRYYGTGDAWRKLAAHNQGRVGADGSVRQGVTLQIPDASVLGVAARQADSPSTTPVTTTPRDAKTSKPAKPEAAPARAATRYTVKKGDTLSRIAQRTLGSSKRMTEILAANRGKISDPDDIREGMVLSIPAKG